MTKPKTIQEANALVEKRVTLMAKARTALSLAERNYLKAREWLHELAGKP